MGLGSVIADTNSHKDPIPLFPKILKLSANGAKPKDLKKMAEMMSDTETAIEKAHNEKFNEPKWWKTNIVDGREQISTIKMKESQITLKVAEGQVGGEDVSEVTVKIEPQKSRKPVPRKGARFAFC